MEEVREPCFDSRTPPSEFAMRESTGLGQETGKRKITTAVASAAAGLLYMGLRAKYSRINIIDNTHADYDNAYLLFICSGTLWALCRQLICDGHDSRDTVYQAAPFQAITTLEHQPFR